MRPPVAVLPSRQGASRAGRGEPRRLEPGETHQPRPHHTFKKLMVAIMLLATVGTLASGTLATFTAQTRNPSNTLTAGTLVLLDEINASTSTDCYSTGVTSGTFTNGDVNTSCTSNNFTPTSLKPGDPPVTMKVMVKNVGSTPAATLSLYMTACTAGDNPSVSFHYPGGDPCTQVQMYIQEWTDSTYTTARSCAYGTTASASTCNFQATSPTLSAFTAAYNSAPGALVMSGGLASGSARYFTVALQLPSTATNVVQGRESTFDFNWYLGQI